MYSAPYKLIIMYFVLNNYVFCILQNGDDEWAVIKKNIYVYIYVYILILIYIFIRRKNI